MFNIWKNILVGKSAPGSKNRVYFDSASAVPALHIAKRSYLTTVSNFYANASSIHAEGERSKEELFEARKRIAKCMHAKSSDVHFTSSTTEANNIFIKGIALANKGGHIIYSNSDHSAIVDVVESCKLFDSKITSIVPSRIGVLPIEEILKAITEETRLICFSYVHSELGTVQPVRKIVQAVHEHCKEKNYARENWPKIFIDATQAVKYESIDVGNLLVDGMSFGSSKLGGVSGAAVLYVKNATMLVPIISGGGQEEGIRSGTENLGAIAAFADVLEQVTNPIQVKESREKVFKLRNYCVEKLKENFKDTEVEIFGDTKFKYNKFYEHSAPHILLISLIDMLGEETLLRLDAKGISVSTASACSLLENSGSNFLKSVGEPIKAKETIRLSFSESNSENEIEYFVKCLKDIKEKFI